MIHKWTHPSWFHGHVVRVMVSTFASFFGNDILFVLLWKWLWRFYWRHDGVSVIRVSLLFAGIRRSVVGGPITDTGIPTRVMLAGDRGSVV